MKKELLLKYIEGDCSDTEKAAITEWLDEPGNMKEFIALRKLYDITIWQTPPNVHPEQKTNKRISLQRRSYFKEILKIAAVLVIAMVGSYFLFQQPVPEDQVVMQTLNVPAGQRAEISLADGTSVWLNAKSTLTFPNRFSGDTREVHLDGEGFFDVTSSESEPFIVKTGKFDVRVTGTEFNLMAYSGSNFFEASLFEGAVEILMPNGSTVTELHPNERIYMIDDRFVVAPISNMNHFLWKEGIISFDDEPFSEVVEKLELYFDLTIEVKNEKILNHRWTGKFRTKDGVEHILKVLQLRVDFKYKIDEKRNVITIE